jgi:hypothetical protein
LDGKQAVRVEDDYLIRQNPMDTTMALVRNKEPDVSRGSRGYGGPFKALNVRVDPTARGLE